MARLATGIEGFGALVQGGLPVGATVVLQGPPGQEKLRFALTFLAEGLKTGSSGLVVISSQSPDAVLAELRSLGVNLDEVTKENRLRIVDWYSWSEEPVHDIEDRGLVIRSSIDLTNLGVALSRAIAALATDQPPRAVIEVLSPATNAYELTQVYAFAQSAKKKFDRYRFTSLVLLEKDMHSASELTTLHQPFDGVIEIERVRTGDRILRKVGVLHLKDSSPDPTFRLLEITESGMRVVRETAKPSAAPASAAPASGTVLESQGERARRLNLIMQIASERLKLNPKDPDALFALAAAQATLDDPRGGLQSLDRLADLDPNYPGLWVLKTKLHARLGEADRARQSRIRAQQAERPEPSPAGGTVPCPMCDASVPIDATSCANCGVKFAQTRSLEDELEDLEHATIQDMVQEEMDEIKAETASKKPIETKAVEAEREILPPSRPPVPKPVKPQPKPSSKKGLTNGLVLARGAGRRTGMTNGLRGRTNGLRGRTNGLTNGLGRTNGLTNGLGRTNGLTNGLGRTNGLTNGLGRTNGITNGLGRTNGLTNGLGGGRAAGFRRSGVRGMIRTAGWKLYVIPLAVVGLLLLPLFFVPPYSGPVYPIQIDGQFNDWASIATESMGAGGVPNPNVDIVRFGVVPNLGPVAFYVEVAGSILMGGGATQGTMDTDRIFVDIDGAASTGYRIDGLGADRMIEVSGHNGSVVGSTLWEFDSNQNQRDWSGWIKGTATPAAASGSRLEAEADWLAGASPSVPPVATVHTLSWDGQTDTGDFPVSPGLGTLSVVADPQAPDIIAGNRVNLLRLNLAVHGQPVALNSLHVQIAGTAPANASSFLQLTDGANVLAQVAPTSRDVTFSFSPIELPTGSSTTLFVVGDFASSTGETFGVRLPSIHPFGLGAGVVSLRENPGARVLGYLGAIPAVPRVDGAFDEWAAVSPDAPGDVSPRSNPNIDLAGYAAQRSGLSTFLYTDVTGRILHGTPTPELPRQVPPQSQGPADTDRDGVPDAVDPFPMDFNNDGVPDSQTNGDYDGDGIVDYGFPGGTDLWLNTTIPNTFPAPYAGRSVSVYIGPDNRPSVLGEDIIRIFVDVDNSSFSGYSIGGIGADRLVEIRGKDDEVTKSSVLAFSGSFPGQWSWTPLSPVTVALGYHALELSIPMSVTRLYVETGDFWGSVDSTTAVPARVAQPMSLRSASVDQPLSLASPSLGPGPASTLLDPGSSGLTTVYNQQRKVVRAGMVANQTACDATNSGGCFYAVYQDQVPSSPDSAYKDGGSVAVPTSLGLLDSIPTSLAAGNNLVIAFIQFNNTGAAARLLTAGNVQLRRGTLTSDPLLAQTEFEIRLPATGTPGEGGFAALLYRDIGVAASPTYGVFAAADATGANAEVKFVVISGLASSDSAFADGGSVAIQVSTTSLGSVSTTFPAASSSLPNLVIATIQTDSVSGRYNIPGGFSVIRRGTLSSDPVIASNQFNSASANNAAPDGVYQILVALDAAGAANQAYSVWTINNVAANTVNGEAKILTFRGLSASSVDTVSVSVGNGRTVLGTATTSFGTGDDVVIGAMEMDAVGSTRTIVTGADDIRRTGETTGSGNQFGQTVSTLFNDGSGLYKGYLRKVSTTISNPSYEGAMTGPAASSLNGELKMLVIHVRDTFTGWDRILLNRSLDTGGAVWGAPIVLASGRSSDSPLLYNFDSAEPSIAMDSGGYLHVVWVSASTAGDQTILNLVRYTKTLVAYPTQAQLASPSNWASVTVVDDTATGYMPTISTDSGNSPHLAWSGSKTSGTAYYKNKAGGSWNPTLSWGTTYTGLSVDVSPRNNYVNLARYYEAGTNEIQYLVCKNVAISKCANAANFTKSNGAAGYDTVAAGSTGASSAFVDGGSVTIALTETSLASLATTFPAGDNYILVTVAISTVPQGSASTIDIAGGSPGNLKLKRGASVLSSNEFVCRVGGTTPDSTHFPSNYCYLLFKDVGAPSSPAYEVTALAGGSGMNGEAKILALQGLTGSFQDGGSVAIGTSETTVLSHVTSLASADNLIIAAVQVFDTNNGGAADRWIVPGNLRLKRGASVLSSNEYTYDLMKTGSAKASQGILLLARDVGAPANPTYTVTALSSNGAGVNGEAKIMVISAGGTVQHALTDGTSVAIGTSETTFGTVSTSFAAGENVVIASNEYRNTAAGQVNLAAANSRIVQGGTSRVNNEFEIRLDSINASQAGNMDEGLLWRQYAGPASPSYDSRALASATGIQGETKIAAIHIRDGTDIERPSYPSLATTYDVNGDLWIAYSKDLDATTRAIYVRFLDYPTNGFAASEVLDSLSGTLFTRPTIGLDKDGNVYALYVGLSMPQLYFNSRIGGTWGTRTAIDVSTDYPSLIVRAPDDPAYGTSLGAVYWKSSTSETYFYYIPEFESAVIPVLGSLLMFLFFGQRVRSKVRLARRGPWTKTVSAAPPEAQSPIG